MNNKEYQEKYQLLKDQLIGGKKMTLEGLRETNEDIIKANREYGQRSTALGANTFVSNGKRPGGRVSKESYQKQLDHLKDIRDDEENKVIRPGFQKRVKDFIKEEFDDAPDRIEQLEEDISNDPDLQWLKDPNEKEKDPVLDEWEELDMYPEEDDVDEGFPGDEEGDGTQNQQINQNPIDLQTEFPGFDVEETNGVNNTQPDIDPDNGNPGKKGPEIEPS